MRTDFQICNSLKMLIYVRFSFHLTNTHNFVSICHFKLTDLKWQIKLDLICTLYNVIQLSSLKPKSGEKKENWCKNFCKAQVFIVLPCIFSSLCWSMRGLAWMNSFSFHPNQLKFFADSGVGWNRNRTSYISALLYHAPLDSCPYQRASNIVSWQYFWDIFVVTEKSSFYAFYW